jgi:hypothetical protein
MACDRALNPSDAAKGFHIEFMDDGQHISRRSLSAFGLLAVISEAIQPGLKSALGVCKNVSCKRGWGETQ